MVHFGLTFWLLKKKQDWGCTVSSIKKRVLKMNLWNWTIVPPESWTAVKLLTTCLQFLRMLTWWLWQFLHKLFHVTNCAFTCMSCMCEQHFCVLWNLFNRLSLPKPSILIFWMGTPEHKLTCFRGESYAIKKQLYMKPSLCEKQLRQSKAGG